MTFDYTCLHDMTNDQIIVDATLLYPHEGSDNSGLQILQDGMQRFCPPGLRCCFVSWRNGIDAVIFFPDHQSAPTGEQLVSAFYLKLVEIQYEENREGNSLWD
jgi:hypothetical protein